MTDYSGYRFLKVEQQDGVAVITMNRPEVLNAIHDISLAWEEHCFYSQDLKEATSAFVQKREPKFQSR